MRARVALLVCPLSACAHTEPPPVVAPPADVSRSAPAPPAAPPPGPTAAPAARPPAMAGAVETGRATWYGRALAGHRTASGERFDPSRLTAAHKTLPLGAWVDVRRSGTERVVRVRINDRGPFGEPDVIIDLSRAAFERIGIIREGVIPVEVRVVSLPPSR